MIRRRRRRRVPPSLLACVSPCACFLRPRLGPARVPAPKARPVERVLIPPPPPWQALQNKASPAALAWMGWSGRCGLARSANLTLPKSSLNHPKKIMYYCLQILMLKIVIFSSIHFFLRFFSFIFVVKLKRAVYTVRCFFRKMTNKFW